MMLKGKWDNVGWGEDFVRGERDKGTIDGEGGGGEEINYTQMLENDICKQIIV